MEAMQGIIEGVKGATVEVGTSRKVTEVEEGRNPFNDIWMDKTANST